MNAIRAVMTVFLLMVLSVSVFGWRWSADLPAAKLMGARVALSITALSSLTGLGLLWGVKPPRSS